MAIGDRYKAKGFGPDGWGIYDVAWSDSECVWSPATGSSDLLLVPGFVDIHIHGAFGFDFMSISRADMLALCDRLAEAGYEGFLPTTVSASARDVLAALANLPEHPMVLGFHLEGPFISPQYPGAQPPEAIEEPPASAGEWDAVLNDPRLRVATLAPEIPGNLALAKRLILRGAIVSMGHSAATLAQATAGRVAGARHTTHTFNAMRGLHHREPGLAGFALIGDVDCELIYDRLHVARESVDILLRCKGPDRVIAVSDGTAASGLGNGRTLTMWNQAVETRNGGVYLEGTSTLAGSAITLLEAFRNLADDFGEEVATRLCCMNPRRAMAMPMPPRVYVEFGREREFVGIRRVAYP